MDDEKEFPLEHLDAIRRQDLAHVSRSMTLEDLEKMKLAEEVFDLHYRRRTRNSMLVVVAQMLLGLVAIGGVFQNAFQNYENNKEQAQQQKADQERWEREFDRARETDKSQAFFKTSALATDKDNPDKRIVGYSLLQEFVRDGEYNAKATLLLETALQQELARNTASNLGEDSRSAVTAILMSLAGTDDCKALEQTARSVDQLAKRLASGHNAAEASEVFDLYVRLLAGRAPLVCSSFADIRRVWTPLREALQKNPALGGLPAGTATPEAAARRIAEILRDSCLRELRIAGSSDCDEVIRRYVQRCERRAATSGPAPACEVIEQTAKDLAAGGATPPEKG